MDRMPLDYESISDVLRATSIVEAAIETAQASEWQISGRYKQRDLDLTLRVVEVFKGELEPQPGAVFTVHTVQFAPAIPRFFAVPGAWSPYEPKAGDLFVIFNIGNSTIRVEPAGTAVPDLQRVVAAGVPQLSIGATISLSSQDVATWGPLFGKYLEARLPECFFESLSDFERYLTAMEDPSLSENVRFVLLSAAYTKLMLDDPAPPDFIAALLAATARVLQLPSGDSFREAIFDTWLPNLLGLNGGLEPKQASDILNVSPSERSAIEGLLTSSADPSVVTWMES